MAPLIWVGLGVIGGFGLCAVAVLACLPHFVFVGSDPTDDLPGFDDDEAHQLLTNGA